VLDNVIIEPMKGDFDADKLRRWLEQRGDSCVDPLGSGMYMIAGSSDAVEALQIVRRADPSRFPACALVRIDRSSVLISQEWGDKEERAIACEFAKFIFEEGNCVVLDETGNDLTELVRKEGMDVLF
jgi:hypothetical protein